MSERETKTNRERKNENKKWKGKLHQRYKIITNEKL